MQICRHRDREGYRDRLRDVDTDLENIFLSHEAHLVQGRCNRTAHEVILKVEVAPNLAGLNTLKLKPAVQRGDVHAGLKNL